MINPREGVIRENMIDPDILSPQLCACITRLSKAFLVSIIAHYGLFFSELKGELNIPNSAPKSYCGRAAY